MKIFQLFSGTDYRYLKRQVVNRVIDFINENLLINSDFVLVHKNEFISHKKSIKKIMDLGIELLTIYDIGAHNGDFSRRLQKYLPQSKFYLFEANIKHEVLLKKSGMEFAIGLLGEKNLKAEFYEVGGTGDSRFKEQSEIYSNVQPSILDVSTLDQVVKERNWPVPDLIKIDTQGSELLILEGAINTLPQAKALLIETQFQSTLNENPPKFIAVIDYLEEYGFLIFDICEIHRSRLGIAQIDFLFMRREFFNH
jgi:FkbM family methyltransferase